MKRYNWVWAWVFDASKSLKWYLTSFTVNVICWWWFEEIMHYCKHINLVFWMVLIHIDIGLSVRRVMTSSVTGQKWGTIMLELRMPVGTLWEKHQWAKVEASVATDAPRARWPPNKWRAGECVIRNLGCSWTVSPARPSRALCISVTSGWAP